jgi:lambda family phage tail tape measure protein
MATGKAGSLLIDIAANTAQLKKDMADAQASITSFGKAVEGIGTVVKAAFAAMVAREVLGFIEDLTKSVGDLADQAKRVGLSTDDFQAFTTALQKAGESAANAQSVLAAGTRFLGQALEGNKQNITTLNQLGVTILDTSGKIKPFTTDLQAMAQAILKIQDPLAQAAAAQEIFHRSGAEVLPVLQQIAGGFEALRAAAGPEIIPADTIQRFKDFNTTIQTIQRTLVADLAVALDNLAGGPSNNAGQAIEKIKKDFDDLGASIRVFSSSEAGQALGAVWGTFLFNIDLAIKGTNLLIQLITSIPGLLDKAMSAIRAGSLAAQELAKNLPSSDPGLSAGGAGGPASPVLTPDQKAALQTQQDAAVKSAQETADKITAIKKDAFDREQQRQLTALNTRTLRQGPPEQFGPPAPVNNAGSNPPPRSTGAAKVDAFGNTLKGLQDQAAAVTQATKDLDDATGLASKEAERLAQLQIDIARDTAAAVKAAHATTPDQKAVIASAVADLDNAKFKFNDLKQVMATADQVQSTYGDGTKALSDRLGYLQKALDDNKISQEDYAKAVTAATEAQAIQAEQSKGLQGGFDGIVAGWNKAALAASGAGADMKIGEQAFTQTFSLMSNAISEFVTTGQLDFGKLAASFATMLANMAIQWAAASFIKNLMGGPSANADSIMGLVPVSASAAPTVSGGMMASGGDVMPGRSYLVGENGPERFIPRMPGTIAANSNGSNVAVNVDMSGNGMSDNDPRKTVEFARRVKAAVVDTISNEKRPGGILYTRQSA